MNYTPYNSLPLWARISIERLDADPGLRSAAQLDQLLDAYAQTYNDTVDHDVRLSTHRECIRRVRDFKADHCAECGEVFPCSDYGRRDVLPYISTRHFRKGR